MKELAEKNMKEALLVSKKMSLSLFELEDKVFPWSDRKEKLHKTYFKELTPHWDLIKDMPDPEEWHIRTSNQFAAGKVFGNPTRLKKFLGQNRTLLNNEEKDVIEYFMDNPWFYSLFSVEESPGRNFLRIYDYSRNSSLLLFSEGVYQMHRQGKKLFLCLLLNNGECHQTYGLISYFQGFNVRDFECFAGFTSYHFAKTGDLSLSIFHNPVPYFLLYRFADMPVTVHKDEPITFCAHSLKVQDFSPGKYSKAFDIKKKSGVFKCTLKGNKSPVGFPTIYYDEKKRLLLLNAAGLKRYQGLVKILDKEYDFPLEPSWHVSAQMLIALEQVLGVKNPVLYYDRLFAPEPDPESTEQIERLNALMEEMMEKRNFNLDYSLKEMAEKHGLPLETVQQLQAQFDSFDVQRTVDIEGGFADFIPPPPAGRFKFSEMFRHNSLFEFRNSAKAETLFRIKQPKLRKAAEEFEYESLTLLELPELIEDLFYKYMDTDNCTILLYTFYLLSKKGMTFQKVSDYAVEFLKIFWQIIYPSKSQVQTSRFIKEYGIFCFEVLLRVGLIEADCKLDKKKARQADYSIKASDFFYEWIYFPPSH